MCGLCEENRMIRIRLRRVGKKAKRDGAFLETLGSYDPHANPPSVQLNEERTREWLSKGAQPSEAAEKILRRVGLLAGKAAAAPVAVAEPPAKAGKKASGKAAVEAPVEVPAEAPAATEAPAAEAEAPADEPAAEAPATEAPAAETEAPADEPAETKEA
jgi:small subunit ribosomal protein S16